jgi:hypothetical protein
MLPAKCSVTLPQLRKALYFPDFWGSDSSSSRIIYDLWSHFARGSVTRELTAPLFLSVLSVKFVNGI